MNEKVITIKTNGDTETLTPKTRPRIKKMQAMVGGYIIPVPGLIRYGDDWGIMVVNEDGDPLNLPFNFRASAIAHQRIVGDAIMLIGWEL